MADTKISALTQLAACDDVADKFVIVDDSAGTTKYVNWEDICISGAWTPTLKGSTVAGTQTYTTQTGRYVRIGKLCWISAYILINTKDGATSGALYVDGLPFTVRNTTNYPALALSALSLWTLTSSDHILQAFCNINATTIALRQTNISGSTATVPASAFTNSTGIILTGCYEIA